MSSRVAEDTLQMYDSMARPVREGVSFNSFLSFSLHNALKQLKGFPWPDFLYWRRRLVLEEPLVWLLFYLWFAILSRDYSSFFNISHADPLWNMSSFSLSLLDIMGIMLTGRGRSPASGLHLYNWTNHFGVGEQDSEKFWESRRFSQDMHVVTTSFCVAFKCLKCDEVKGTYNQVLLKLTL